MSNPIAMPPRQVGGQAYVEAPVRTGWTTTVAPVALDDLSDVDTSGEASGDVLTFTGNQWQPAMPPSPTPPTQWFHGSGPPPDVIVGAHPGDMYVDDAPDGLVYQLT